VENMNELAAALAKAQGAIEPAQKDRDNPYFKSRYATLSSIREAMRHAFAANGLSIVQIPEVVSGPDAVGQLRLRTILMHASGQSLDCGVLSADVDLNNPQKIGSAITYFRRYALAAVSQATADDDDDDGNAASAKPAAPAAKVNAKDAAYIVSALKEIQECTTLDELQNIGSIIKDKPAPIQNALRAAYSKKQHELKHKETENAPSDPQLPG